MVVAKIFKRAQFDVLAVKRMSSGSILDSTVSENGLEDGAAMDEQFLHEIGGNIGQWKLEIA